MNSAGFLVLLLTIVLTLDNVAADQSLIDEEAVEELDEDIDIDEEPELEPRVEGDSNSQLELKCKANEVILYDMKVTQQTWGGEAGNKVIVEADVEFECISIVDGSDNLKGMRYRMDISHVIVKVVDPTGNAVEKSETEDDEGKEDEEEEEGLEANDEPSQNSTKTLAGLPYEEGPYPLDKKFSRPFYFIQLRNGTIVSVQHPPDDDRHVVNIKKSLASLFQTQTKYGDSDVEETDASSLHKAHYRVAKNEQGRVVVNKQVNKDDIEKFPKGSGADPSVVDLEESEEIQYKDGEPEKISGQITTSISKSTDEDSPSPDSEEYESNSHLDETMRLENKFSLQMKGRRKKRSPRSDQGRRSVRLTSSSLISEVNERDTIRAHLNYMKQKATPTQAVLKAIRLANEDVLNQTYHRFLMLLDLEGHCEFLQCSPREGTPIANALVHYFYEGDEATRIRLLSSLVASASQLAQQALNDVLSSPKLYGVPQSDVLHALAYLERPSPQIIKTVTDLCNSTDLVVKSSALLAIGALARYSSNSVSDSITLDLAERLAHAQASHKVTETRYIAILLHALSNTRNAHAAEVLLNVLKDARPDDMELQLTVSLALGDFMEMESVVDAFISLLHGNQTVSDVVAGAVIDILTNKLIIEQPPAKIPHLQELEFALDQKLYGHSMSNFEHEIGKRSRRATETFRSYDWGNTASQYNDIASLSSRRADKASYPLNKAFLFGQKFGVDRLHMRYTVGAFGGLNTQRKTGKLFSRAVAYAHAFGFTKPIVDISLTVLLNTDSISYQPLIRFLGRTVLRSSRLWKTCKSDSLTLVPHKTFTVFQKRFSVPVLYTSLSFELRSRASYSVTADYEVCLIPLKGSASVTGNGGLSATAAVGLLEILVKRICTNRRNLKTRLSDYD
jgi:hypothetical protein